MSDDLVKNNHVPAGEFSDFLTGVSHHVLTVFNAATDGVGQIMQFTSPAAAGGWAAFGAGILTYALMKKTDGMGASRNERMMERLFNTHRGTMSHRLLSTVSMLTLVYAASSGAYNYVGNTVHGHESNDARYSSPIQIDQVRRDAARQSNPAVEPPTRTVRNIDENKRDMVDPFVDQQAPQRSARNDGKKTDPFSVKP